MKDRNNPANVQIGECVYCGKGNTPLNGTPEVEVYCIERLRLTRDNCTAAIREIMAFRKSLQKTKRGRTEKP